MFYYYGAKHRLARYYPSPKHRLVVEPFAGAAGYAMFHAERDLGLRVLLIEKDPRVVDNWKRLLGMDPEEILRLQAPEVGDRTEDFLVMCSAASNALAKSRGFTFTARAAGEFDRMRRRMARVVGATRGRISVSLGDYRAAPDVEATWFIDPPYKPGASGSKTRCPSGMGYARGCDSSSLDYEELGEWCMGRNGQVIVCEAGGSDWLPFRSLRQHQNSQGSVGKELVWVSGEGTHG